MADVMKEDDEDGEELVIVEEPPEADEDDEDERVAQGDDDEEGDDQEDEREAIRDRRRREKLERKQRRDEAIKRDKLEMDFLRKRNEDLERRLTAQEHRSHQADLSSLDAAIAQAAKEADMADKVIAKAVAAGNGDDTQAMRYRDQALARINALNARKQQTQQMPAKQPQVDERMLHHAQEFIRENPWYDVQGRNEDSKIVIAIDQTLVGEGFDPTSPDYWSELRKRAAKRLPERFGREKKEGRTPRGGPAVGSGREHAPASTRREVYISPERKAALIEAGVWDDPVLRQKYVQRYAEYDRQNRS